MQNKLLTWCLDAFSGLIGLTVGYFVGLVLLVCFEIVSHRTLKMSVVDDLGNHFAIGFIVGVMVLFVPIGIWGRRNGRGLAARLIRRFKVRPRRCAKCGYDLFANATGTCPECGSPIPPRQRAILSRLASKSD